MENLRQYFLSVVAAAIVTAVVTQICGKKGTLSMITKLICGLFLALTVIRPIAEIEIGELAFLTEDFYAEAQAAISTGEEIARESLESIIKSEAEAYILDKAKALNASIQVEVALSNDAQPVPAQVYVRGDISPYAKTQLERVISEDLGIAKEYQIWIQ